MNELRVAMLLAACVVTTAAANERYTPPDEPRAAKDAALLVILNTGGGDPPISVYRVTEGGQDFIGILGARDKIAYPVSPGDHLFMVIGGENADFMEAHLDAGKTYYARVAVRMGVGYKRYSLYPIGRIPDHAFSARPEQVPGITYYKWVRQDDADRSWYSKRREFVDQRRERFLQKWNTRTDEGKEHPTLNREDGV